MPKLEHWNLRTLDIAATIAFYEDVVGLSSGAFPGKPGSGAWLYDDAGVPVVHVVKLDASQYDREMARIEARLGDLAGKTDLHRDGSGVIDHVAFACDNFADALERVTSRGLPHRIAEYPSLGLTQILVNDPNGVTLELNFRKVGGPPAEEHLV